MWSRTQRAGHVRHVLAAYGDPASAGLVEPAEHEQQAALAGAGGSQDAEAGPRGDGEAHVAEDLGAVAVPEAHMVEGDVPGHGQFPDAGPVMLHRRVQHLADTGDGHPGLAHLGDDAAQTAHRPDEHIVIEGEGDELPLRHLPPDAQNAAQDDDQHDLQTAGQVADSPEIRHGVGRGATPV